jgi:hypothetical protein
LRRLAALTCWRRFYAREGRGDTATSASRPTRLSRLLAEVADSSLRITDRDDDGVRAVGATDADADVGFA